MPLPWLRTSSDLLIWALVAHVVADWLLQTEWMARNKLDLRNPAAYAHAGVYALCMLPIFPWPYALGIGISHLLVDTRAPVRWWMRWVKGMHPHSSADPRAVAASKTVEMGVDQAFHILLLAIAALLAA